MKYLYLYYEREFIEKGGIIETPAPHYLFVGECEFLKSWFVDPIVLKIPIDNLIYQLYRFVTVIYFQLLVDQN